VQRLERPLRLTTGLILFAFATSHLVNHAFGIRSAAAMDAASAFLLIPWQTYVGLTVLYAAFLTHGLLGLYALYRRRHLRLPAGEAWQLALGLAIPLLLIMHAFAIRLYTSLYGRDFGYERVLYAFWVERPDFWLPWQLLLLLIVWIHGCIGLRTWLRSKGWYARIAGPLTALATLVPVLALLGVINAGLNLREAAQRNPAYAATLAAWQRSPAAAQYDPTATRIINGVVVFYVALVIGTLGLRAARDWHAKRFNAIRISYPGTRIVTVPLGFSVLEASRWAGVPHASVCGGRGRCSTCKVRIVASAQALAPPGPVERATLRRIAAPAPVRLACQLRPTVDVTVEPLVPIGGGASGAARFDAAIAGGRELQIAAMFVDLRESTRLATGRLPYDALFLFDRYIQAVTGGIRRYRGHTTSIAGDGVMSVFGVDTTAPVAARNAFQAALDVWSGLETLNAELAAELETPLRIGIGIHVGDAVVGLVSTSDSQSLQFLGDTGNTAAKLEAQSKELGCTLVASRAALDLAAAGRSEIETTTVVIPGKTEPIEVAVFRQKSALERTLRPAPAAS
jgi:adenylate cyclase